MGCSLQGGLKMQIKIRSYKKVKTITVHDITEHAGIKYAQRVEWPAIRTFIKLPRQTWMEVKK